MGSEPERIKVLFLCTGNACRSQMAEGWARHLKSDRLDAFSGGVAPQGVDPRAIRVMSEAGVDISGHTSKHVDTLEEVAFDYVVTLCDQAQRGCPVFPAKTRLLHVGFDDPPGLAADSRNEEEALGHYRRVRDEIRRFVESLPEVLLEEEGEEKDHG
ncbi:MAG: arsenate reductase ArsC [Syntrophobacteraceae bacterium]